MINQLIVNADDFAITKGVSDAIIDCFENGVVTSTTLYATCDEDNLIYAKQLLNKHSELHVGVHLVLSNSLPLLKSHNTLVNEKGYFRFSSTYDLDEAIDMEEVYLEWRAQIQRIQKNFRVTHFDSHHHMHLEPQFLKITKRLSQEFSLPYRSNQTILPYEVEHDTTFYNHMANVTHLEEIMKSYDGILELMVHPGVLDDISLAEISSYTSGRVQEAFVLKSNEIKELIQQFNIELITYNDIQ